jgi:hypothetical protein
MTTDELQDLVDELRRSGTDTLRVEAKRAAGSGRRSLPSPIRGVAAS